MNRRLFGTPSGEAVLHSDEYRLLRDLVCERLGIWFGPESRLSLERRLRDRLTVRGLTSYSDYYQLLAYTAALDLDEGVLVYFQHDGDVPDEFITVSNVGKVLRTFALDLAGDRATIESKVEELADWIVMRARASTAPTPVRVRA